MATPIGKKAFFISDRSGFRFHLDQRVKEPGTEFIVAKSESDGIFNLVIISLQLSAKASIDRLILVFSLFPLPRLSKTTKEKSFAYKLI